MANLLLIRDLCEKNKIKIRELASRIGKDESSIQSMIRTGSTNTKTLEAIAEVFNVSPGIFFDNPSEDNTGSSLNKDAEIIYLKKILEEKERLIQVLLNKK
ncbi:helix-turn-helix domain-containing protein [Bacteroides difficilis]|jgi:transcriptional regulator with XRE-family HTH domain|uniref:Helix-turn-helix transcriptional regulator n=1 Tax=Bacteroides difficilis TaxID=2763021 RepID=A0ABR7CEC8_9BACE|nr:helix-turn-helix transcriptional regulator [Bacteroides difficilis]MBC5606147.1 helix-turn-helix transcriptional regulator [Bacteroides difficilis]